jgi:intracellular sulfur oxidation DsrE/DsrF family protein
MAEYKVLIHISDRDKWSSTLTMCLNLARETTADALELVILADIFAGAVCVACDRNLRKLMNELVESGHTILACEQSLRNLNLRPEALPEFIGRVPNSLSEIIRRQCEGFHYIKL